MPRQKRKRFLPIFITPCCKKRNEAPEKDARRPIRSSPEEIWFVKFRVLFATLLSCSPALAEPVRVAVAANFALPAKVIAANFAQETGESAELSFGATGKLYAQIRNGAPFAVLLAADAETPAKLEQQGDAVNGSRFTYAVGRLVLWSPKPDAVDPQGEVLKKGHDTHLAIADPKLAPYGAAAVETLKALSLLPTMQPRFVQGENIAQAYQFVASGNAGLGFVALSQVMREGRIMTGSAWIVPDHFHQPIRQDAVILRKGEGSAAARAWMDYLKGDKAKRVMRSFGYGF
ncbi:MAG: molybdate ABC transporter substrate-binding protein [Magnetococcales bacterium]|nr:molybdate ABC transporter substrate-binding protein [Magnetococcales bacterium]